MPWKTVPRSAVSESARRAKPPKDGDKFALIKPDSGKVVAWHPSREKSERHRKAIAANYYGKAKRLLEVAIKALKHGGGSHDQSSHGNWAHGEKQNFMAGSKVTGQQVVNKFEGLVSRGRGAKRSRLSGNKDERYYHVPGTGLERTKWALEEVGFKPGPRKGQREGIDGQWFTHRTGTTAFLKDFYEDQFVTSLRIQLPEDFEAQTKAKKLLARARLNT